MNDKKRIILIISGGIAAYKSLDLVRHLTRHNCQIDCVMTKGAQAFIQPLSFASLSGNPVRMNLFDLDDESHMNHIALSRAADLIVVAPASANLMARMAQGLADDLATTLLLASTAPIMLAPAMNWRMWEHPATQRNIALLKEDGVVIINPDKGEMACGENGVGRLAQTELIAQKALNLIARAQGTSQTPISLSAVGQKRNEAQKALQGKTILITAGSTREAIDPVRYIGNHSSGKQGYALADILQKKGAKVILISARADLPPPANIIYHKVESASDMLKACLDQLDGAQKIDMALCVAAVCDWRVKPSLKKLKKTKNALPDFAWEQNPDILFAISTHPLRPDLVIGFAAETENLLKNARAKRKSKQCDWVIANDVSQNVFGSDDNQAIIIKPQDEIHLPLMTKTALAETIAQHIIHHVTPSSQNIMSA